MLSMESVLYEKSLVGRKIKEIFLSVKSVDSTSVDSAKSPSYSW